MKKRTFCLTVLALALFLAAPALAAGEQGYERVETFQSGTLASTGGMTPSVLLEEDTLYGQIEAHIAAKSRDYLHLEGAFPVDVVRETFRAVVNDHPEFFYVENGYSYYTDGSGNVTALKPYYIDAMMTPEVEQAFDQALNQAMEVVEGVSDPLEQALLLHDYLAVHIDYNWAVATGNGTHDDTVYNAYGALVNGDAVCQGYALAYQLLMNRVGIPCVLVSSDSLNHAWNAVELDGQWYHVDVTWDDPVPNLEGGCNHDYFLLSYDSIATGNHFRQDDWTFREGESTRYESGYIFNESETSIYFYDGAFYYATASALKQAGSLELGDSSMVRSVSWFRNYTPSSGGGYTYYPAYPTVWANGLMYYTAGAGTMANQRPVLYVVDLRDGTSTLVEELSFQAADSWDGSYPYQQDSVGLMYDQETGVISAVSKTRPDVVLATVEAATYPPAWDAATDSGIIGWDARGEQVGIYLSGEIAEAVLISASYQDGRIGSVSIHSGLETGLNVVKLDTISPGDKLFLLEAGSWKPVGEAFSPN